MTIVRSCGTLWESSFQQSTLPTVYYQASDPPRFKITVNKTEVFVYFSADSTGDEKAAARMTRL